MGINIKSKNKSVSMSCSTFNEIRLSIAKSFNIDFYNEYKKIFEVIVNYPRNYDLNEINRIYNDFETYATNFLKDHNDTETLRMVEFFRMPDVEGEINKNYCKYILKYFNKAYDAISFELKDTLFMGMLKVLEDGEQSGGINWN